LISKRGPEGPWSPAEAESNEDAVQQEQANVEDEEHQANTRQRL
jgi:hypothetical protein